MMNALDYGIIALIFFFVLLSFSRGLVIELVSIIKWLFSIIGARLLFQPVSELVFSNMQPQWLRQSLSFGLFFIIIYFLLSYFGRNINYIVKFFGLKNANHFLGIIFGTFKGILIIMGLVFIANLTQLAESPLWKQSLLIPYFERLTMLLFPFVQTLINSNSTFRSFY